MEIIYLAAGRGTRLKKKTSLIPKCLVKIDKKSIIDHNLNFLRKFKKINIVVGYKYKKILRKFKNQKFNFIRNHNYKKTNMVESTFYQIQN